MAILWWEPRHRKCVPFAHILRAILRFAKRTIDAIAPLVEHIQEVPDGKTGEICDCGLGIGYRRGHFILLSFLLDCAMLLLSSSPLWIFLFACNTYMISRNYSDAKEHLSRTWIVVLVVGIEIVVAVLLVATLGFPICQRLKPYL